MNFNLKNALLLLFLAFVATSCTDYDKKNKEDFQTGTSLPINETKLFEIKKVNNDYILCLRNDQGEAVKYFRLSPEQQSGSIKIPVKKIVCLSTTHIGFLEKLGMTDKIIGMSGAKYIYNPKVREAIKKGDIANLGDEGNLDWEKIVELKPDLITGYEIDGQPSKAKEMAEKYDIPYMPISEYKSRTALGQAEWIKLFGLLTGNFEESLKIYKRISIDYRTLKQLAVKIKEKPTVLVNMPWKGKWHIPGGASNIANLINDAGGIYFVQDNETKTLPYDPEVIIAKGDSIDIWINPGQAKHIQEIVDLEVRTKRIKALQTGKVYNRNKRLSPDGGNDFMESGVASPDLVLRDLIQIFQNLRDTTTYYYYKQIN